MSPFATIFSTFISNYSFIYKDFPCFSKDVFEVVCCRFDVYGKGIKNFWSCIWILCIKKRKQCAESVCIDDIILNLELLLQISRQVTNQLLREPDKVYTITELWSGDNNCVWSTTDTSVRPWPQLQVCHKHIMSFIKAIVFVTSTLDHFKPFPTYNKSALDDFENLCTKTWKITINENLIIKKSWKHCDKRRNCLFWAISSFATFSKVVCCSCFKMRLQVGKG